jgi:hypothetical protein
MRAAAWSDFTVLHDSAACVITSHQETPTPLSHPSVQVPGCSADLSAEPKLYCLRKRICTTHMQVRSAMAAAAAGKQFN